MARQSELDELRKEVEALRTGQFASGALPDMESHVSEINAHLTGAPAPEPLAASTPGWRTTGGKQPRWPAPDGALFSHGAGALAIFSGVL